MTSKGRAGIVVLLAALLAGGVGVFAYLHEPDDAALGVEAAPSVDASVDARASVASKAKGKPNAAGKKKAPRGGKTRVSGRAAGGTAGGGGGAPHHAGAAPAGPSYESAVAANNQHVTMGASAGPDLTDAQLSAPMSDGTFVSACGAPDSMGVTVKVAIVKGHAVGVTVSTDPAAPEVTGCIERHVRSLRWPASAKMDSFVTTY